LTHVGSALRSAVLVKICTLTQSPTFLGRKNELPAFLLSSFKERFLRVSGCESVWDQDLEPSFFALLLERPAAPLPALRPRVRVAL
jgi:hypothetical protein